MSQPAIRYNNFDPVADVEEFHTQFGINYEGMPRNLTPEMLKFRLKFMREELTEYEEHADAAQFETDLRTQNPAYQQSPETRFSRDRVTKELAQVLDALVDLAYVAIGTAHLHGFDFRAAWYRVHRANMRKVCSPDAPTNAEQRMKLKMIKPKGWRPPNHDDLVDNHIHNNEGDE